MWILFKNFASSLPTIPTHRSILSTHYSTHLYTPSYRYFYPTLLPQTLFSPQRPFSSICTLPFPPPESSFNPSLTPQTTSTGLFLITTSSAPSKQHFTTQHRNHPTPSPKAITPKPNIITETMAHEGSTTSPTNTQPHLTQSSTNTSPENTTSGSNSPSSSSPTSASTSSSEPSTGIFTCANPPCHALSFPSARLLTRHKSTSLFHDYCRKCDLDFPSADAKLSHLIETCGPHHGYGGEFATTEFEFADSNGNADFDDDAQDESATATATPEAGDAAAACGWGWGWGEDAEAAHVIYQADCEKDFDYAEAEFGRGIVGFW
jgi:hypothetical protein